MLRNHYTYRSSSEQLRQQISKSSNPLGIGNTNFIWNREKHQLILIMETSQLVSRDINAILKGNRLILEAPLISSYNKPFRTHLIDKVNSNEIDDGLMLIGFTEVTLKSGYRYQLISCQVIDSRLIKVTLGFRPWGRHNNYN